MDGRHARISRTMIASGAPPTAASRSTASPSSHAAAPLSVITRASEIEAPTVRIRPQESLPSNVFHAITPNGGVSSTHAANSAGMAGDM